MAEAGEKEHLTPTRTELVWPGKRTQVERVALPFQVVETINQSRATREQTPMLAGLPPPPLFEGKSTTDTSWKNKLIWGENKYVMASLLQGDPSIGLESLAGRINLIYIDPPFATGQDFSYRAKVGDEEWLKEASIIEETAYRDTWGERPESYLQMMYERLILMRDLLADDGSIYVHLDPTMNHYIKAILDEVFGNPNFRSEVVWRRSNSHNKLSGQYGPIHDSILYYSKGPVYTFHPGTLPFSKGYIESRFVHRDKRGTYQPNYLTGPGVRAGDSGKPWRGFDPSTKGRHWAIPSRLVALLERSVDGLSTQEILDLLFEADLLAIPKKPGGQPMYKQYITEGVPYQDIWAYVPNSQGYLYGTDACMDADVKWLEQEEQKLSYETQKPEGLLQRILLTSSNDGDLVTDFFCGSGTTMVVAENLGRRWIGCDLSRYAIQVSRKRLLDIPGCQPFQVLNLGKYERKHWQVNVLNGHQEDQQKAIADYLRFIVALYHAEPVGGYVHLHGQKAGRWIHVGAADAPVTRAEIMDAVRECQANRYISLDVLGWEWEMGLHDTVRDEARRMGVDLRLLFIPREVMDKRAVEAGDVHFYELAYLKTAILQDAQTVTVRLEDFIIPNPDLVPDKVRSKVKRWSDYIDFWAVDWNYRQDTFHNEWQTYRTRKSPTLRLISDPHPYAEVGSYRILVKVIDIFGNDTTQLLQVTVP